MTEKKSELAMMAAEGIRAGFPSPAQDYMNPFIDLNKELVPHPTATFYGRVVGDSMIDAGVEEGDVLVIDKSIEAKEGDMAVCFIDGEFTLKFLSFSEPDGSVPVKSSGKVRKSYDILSHKELWLSPANDKYPAIKVTEANDFTVWGVVTYIIKKVSRK